MDPGPTGITDIVEGGIRVSARETYHVSLITYRAFLLIPLAHLAPVDALFEPLHEMPVAGEPDGRQDHERPGSHQHHRDSAPFAELAVGGEGLEHVRWFLLR